MGQSISLFLVRAAGLLLAGMLLAAASAPARAQPAENYGLKRFNGDNYDSVPPGAGIPPPAAPAGYAPAPGSTAAPSGYYSSLNPGPAPEVTVSPPAYQPVPAQQATQPPAPLAQGYQPAPETMPYGYKPDLAAAAAPQQRMATADPYAYYRQPAMARENPDYVLGAGDRLHLTVFGETDLSGDFTVDGSGFVRLPLIGQVRAIGYTQQQLEGVIGSALAQGYLKSPRVSVEVAAYRPFYIIGAVNRPGQYAYVDHMSALNAIALAGGFQPGAVESVIFVRREGSNEEVEVPVDRTTPIHPGDVVKVHNTFFSDITNVLSPLSGVAASAATAAIVQ
ncbi:MAG TPA: polysaccharide biosynthesis/export family protein [Rhizomicrobium sp.]